MDMSAEQDPRLFKAVIRTEVVFALTDEESLEGQRGAESYADEILDAAMDGLGASFPGVLFVGSDVEVVKLIEAPDQQPSD